MTLEGKIVCVLSDRAGRVLVSEGQKFIVLMVNNGR